MSAPIVPAKPAVHPKVKATATVASILLALDALIALFAAHVPSSPVVALLAVAHSVLPVLAGYFKAA